MKLNPSEVIAFGGLMLSTILATLGGTVWFANSEKKKYGLERDLNHLKNNQKSIQDGIDLILRENDKRFDALERQVTEIKSELRVQLKTQS